MMVIIRGRLLWFVLFLVSVVSMSMQSSPAFSRNCDPINDALMSVGVHDCDKVLELASGPGEHIVYIANHFDRVQIFQPTDVSLAACESINTRVAEAKLQSRILPARQVDVGTMDWPLDSNVFEAAFAINLLHIAPHESIPNLFKEAARCLKSNAILSFYDTWVFDGKFIGPNNERFDRSLKAQGYSGIPTIEFCDAAAQAAGFRRCGVLHLPANNQFVSYKKQSI